MAGEHDFRENLFRIWGRPRVLCKKRCRVVRVGGSVNVLMMGVIAVGIVWVRFGIRWFVRGIAYVRLRAGWVVGSGLVGWRVCGQVLGGDGWEITEKDVPLNVGCWVQGLRQTGSICG